MGALLAPLRVKQSGGPQQGRFLTGCQHLGREAPPDSLKGSRVSPSDHKLGAEVPPAVQGIL